MGRATVNTDYQPGDPPVPIGAVVRYPTRNGELYTVAEHLNPQDHPHHTDPKTLMQAYPDGTAYHLWPLGMPRKLDVESVIWVRRTSFRVGQDKEP